MNGTAAILEISTLVLAVAVLAWDLISPAARTDPRRGGLFVLAAAGLAGLLAWSFSSPSPLTLTDAFVQDGFALFAKRILLAAALLAVVGMYPYARRRGIADRSGESLVLLLFATVGGMAPAPRGSS
jgi:NADH:ubiquinone oxidoreductase subunit 2 (subunit N)